MLSILSPPCCFKKRAMLHVRSTQNNQSHPMHLGALLQLFDFSCLGSSASSLSLALWWNVTWRRLVHRAACVVYDSGFFSLTTSKRNLLLSHHCGIPNISPSLVGKNSCSSRVKLAVADSASPFLSFPSVLSLSHPSSMTSCAQRRTCRTGRLPQPTATQAARRWPTGEDGTSRQRRALAPHRK